MHPTGELRTKKGTNHTSAHNSPSMFVPRPQYMKMMGVNPLSHFCAWFLDCAVHLLFTIVILTLVLKYGGVLPNSDGFLLFLFFCNYGLSIVAMSFLVSSFFDKTYIAGMTGSLVYVLCFFPFIIVMGLETKLSLSEKSALVSGS